MIILLTHYPDSQGGGGFRSERESAHLNPMGLRKCHPITVKSLIVKVSQKNSSTLTNVLPEEHSIHTREISQEIGNCHMTNTNNLFGEFERKKIWHWLFWQPRSIRYSKGLVINDALNLTWPILIPFYQIFPSSLTLYSCFHAAITCMYKSRILSSFLTLIYPECLVPFPHSLAIEILRLTPASTALLLIPPNQ